MSARTFISLIRANFSAAEWSILSSRADFLPIANQAASSGDVESIIRYGKDLLALPQPRTTPLPPPALAGPVS